MNLADTSRRVPLAPNLLIVKHLRNVEKKFLIDISGFRAIYEASQHFRVFPILLVSHCDEQLCVATSRHPRCLSQVVEFSLLS